MTSASGNQKIELLGRITLRGKVTALTGLHIGGGGTGVSIGGVDLPVIRNALDGEPYIPGSSLKGKMRALLERALALPQQGSVDKETQSQTAKIHYCVTNAAYKKCAVCNVFGIATGSGIVNLPTRLIVRDAHMTEETRKRLEESVNTDMPLTEVKTEVVIDRLTSMANPRQCERVPAGAKFNFEMVYNVYKEPEDIRWFKYVIAAMGLLEGDFLGGQGSRGYGQVTFNGSKDGRTNRAGESADQVDKIEVEVWWADGQERDLGIDLKDIRPSRQLRELWNQIRNEQAQAGSAT